MKNNGCKKGFTLIELLVVVLIIGILAAIALPQYQKAVWKSRAAELMTQARNVYNAQQAYFMEHGHFADNFDLLPIDFKGLTRNTALAQSMGVDDGYVKGDGDSFIWLESDPQNDGVDYGTSGAAFGKGPYAMCGFMFQNQEGSRCGVYRTQGQLLCVDNSEQGTDFCTKLFKGKDAAETCSGGDRQYAMP